MGIRRRQRRLLAVRAGNVTSKPLASAGTCRPRGGVSQREAAVMVDFDESTHTYRVGGKVVPGVTSILAPLQDFGRVSADVLDRKRRLGTHVHWCCEALDMGGEVEVWDDAIPYVDAYLEFMAKTGALVIDNERIVFHPIHRYAGTLDRVLEIGGDEWVVDLKTAVSCPASVGPQTAGYAQAYDGSRQFRRGALMLDKTGRPRLIELASPDDWPVFLSCLTVYRHMERHTK
jgi:hypothetical protein